jgi:hypothetical protein
MLKLDPGAQHSSSGSARKETCPTGEGWRMRKSGSFRTRICHLPSMRAEFASRIPMRWYVVMWGTTQRFAHVECLTREPAMRPRHSTGQTMRCYLPGGWSKNSSRCSMSRVSWFLAFTVQRLYVLWLHDGADRKKRWSRRCAPMSTCCMFQVGSPNPGCETRLSFLFCFNDPGSRMFHCFNGSVSRDV